MEGGIKCTIFYIICDHFSLDDFMNVLNQDMRLLCLESQYRYICMLVLVMCM